MSKIKILKYIFVLLLFTNKADALLNKIPGNLKKIKAPNKNPQFDFTNIKSNCYVKIFDI